MIRPCTLVITQAEKGRRLRAGRQPCLVTHTRTHLPAVSVKGQTLPRGPDAASGRRGARARTFRLGRARTPFGRPWCGSPREDSYRRGKPARSTGERGQWISERTGARCIQLAGKAIRSGILSLAQARHPAARTGALDVLSPGRSVWARYAPASSGK